MNRGQIDKLEKIIEKQLFENIDNLQNDSNFESVYSFIKYLILLPMVIKLLLLS